MAKFSRARVIASEVVSPLREFISDSRAAGIVLICCTFISLVLSNSAWSGNYIGFWQTELHISTLQQHLPHTFLHVINDALMTIFFLLVGMEIKRELLIGELRSLKKSLLPIFAAIGGMVIPAGIYLLWNGGTAFEKGWGIPIATDIAFSLGVLSLLGKRVPVSLKVFLMALAIIDDIGGIITIAVFYAGKINYMYLLLAGSVLMTLGLMNIFKVRQHYLYIALGILMWYLVFNSGIHSTIAGVLLAFTIPLVKVEKLEHILHYPVNFIIMPLFALANTAIVLPTDFDLVFSSNVHHGIFMGLVLGKPIGIILFSMLAVTFKVAVLPKGLTWKHIIGVGLVAGVGFTISIFMATLAFDAMANIQVIAKVAVIAASFTAGIAGFLYLRFGGSK